jgi:hypothetical protein
MSERLVPITRLEKFFGQEDFALELQMGREYLNGDLNFTLVLYSVDLQKTINEASNQYINGSKIMQNEPGNMTFSVYHKELQELEIDIKLGDYIGYWIKENEVRYYSVIDAGTPDYDNKHTYGGYKGFYYTYTATPVSINEFNGL